MAKIFGKVVDEWREAAPPAGSLGPDETSPSVNMAPDTFRVLVRYRASNTTRVFYSSFVGTVDASLTLAQIQAAVALDIVADILAKTGLSVPVTDVRIL